MAVTRAEVDRVASLARLRLDEEEARAMTEQLGSILAHLDALRDVDVTGVDPLRLTMEPRPPLRPEGALPDALLRPVARIAPRWEPPFLVVPRITALDPQAVEGE